jgi:hypothetical protein
VGRTRTVGTGALTRAWTAIRSGTCTGTIGARTTRRPIAAHWGTRPTRVGIARTTRWEATLSTSITARTATALALPATIVGSTSQHPSGAASGHLAAGLSAFAVARGPVVAELAPAAALATATVGAAGTATAWTSAAVTATRATPSVAVAPFEGIALALLTRHQVDGVEELAALLGALGSVLALQDAHETNLVGPASDDVESFHQTRKPITFHLQRSTNRFGFGTFAKRRLWSWSLGRSLGRRLRGGRGLGGRTVGGGLARVGGLHRRFGRRGGFGGSRIGAAVVGLRVLCPVCPLHLCRPLQQNPGKLCDGLHLRTPFLVRGPGVDSRWNAFVDVLRVSVNGKVIHIAANTPGLGGLRAFAAPS